MCVIKQKFILIISLILLLAVSMSQAAEIRYVYDDLGRLIAVVDEQGGVAIYEYDAVGNILAIRRPDTTGPVVITFVNPNQGPVGAQVEIFGVGFSDVPTQNTIDFNGVNATVLAASTTTLTTEVPTGATTGLITVTTPLGSAASPEAFTVFSEITVSPSDAIMVIRASRQFTATLTTVPNLQVTWSVNGILGGDATVGTITAEGIYTAPATVPVPPTVPIRATSVPFSTVFGEATVTIVGEATDFAEAAVSVRFGPPQLGTLDAAPVSVLSGPPPSGTINSSAVSVANSPVITSVTPDNSAQGTIFTITLAGVNFTGATSLVFSRLGSGDTQITSTTPM